MTDHPSTYNAADTHREGIAWDDLAALHSARDGQGVLDGAKALQRGTLAEMVQHVMTLPAGDRSDYVIQKAGDHRLERAEIEALASREDYPRG